MPSAYPRLLQPITLRGGAVLRNRALMGSMHTGLEEATAPPSEGGIRCSRPLTPGRTSQGEGWGHSLEKMGAFFAERARGGVGLMVTGGIAPNAAGRVAPFAATMASSSDARRHRTVTEMVHEARGGCGDAAARLSRAGGGSPPFHWRASRWAAQRLRCSCCTRGGAPRIPNLNAGCAVV